MTYLDTSREIEFEYELGPRIIIILRDCLPFGFRSNFLDIWSFETNPKARLSSLTLATGSMQLYHMTHKT